MHFLSQRTSFWIATFSVTAFVFGNMIGQHGVYAFWASVLGAPDDSAIVYTGTVTPIAEVPDYEKWAQYGGDISAHSFRQVPKEVLRPLPVYSSAKQRSTILHHGYGNDVYSVGHLGSYSTGAEGSGSHPGVDIRVPVGTPVRAMANGIVERVTTDTGFGKYIVIRHPNVPNPENPETTTTLYSGYAHLSVQHVAEGDIVHKGEEIALSGQSGFASGPHLHFQVDREDAPWHLYWPFSGLEARREGMDLTAAVNAGLFQARGYLYTINPMLYAQANYEPAAATLVARAQTQEEHVAVEVTDTLTRALSRREQRLEQLAARREERLRARLSDQNVAGEHAEVHSSATTNVKQQEPEPEPEVTGPVPTAVATVAVHHDGRFVDGEREMIHLTLLDAQGNVVTLPSEERTLTFYTGYGEADFRPQSIAYREFQEGQTEIAVTPRGDRTLVILIQPFGILSTPMVPIK